MADQLFPGDHVILLLNGKSRDGILVQVFDREGIPWGAMFCTDQPFPSNGMGVAPLVDYSQRPGPRAQRFNEMLKTVRYVQENWKDPTFTGSISRALDDLYHAVDAELRYARGR